MEEANYFTQFIILTSIILQYYYLLNKSGLCHYHVCLPLQYSVALYALKKKKSRYFPELEICRKGKQRKSSCLGGTRKSKKKQEKDFNECPNDRCDTGSKYAWLSLKSFPPGPCLNCHGEYLQEPSAHSVITGIIQINIILSHE